ncbi:hypothetical protein [Amycolatopsis thermoflava]|uniref:hypothetical protein n=1 Tax=Amycolatopsis thermoflava TaxID=84480 RepID=UPI003805D661
MSDWLNWFGGTGGVAAVGKIAYDLVKARGESKKVNAEAAHVSADAAQVLVNAATASAAAYAEHLTEVRKEVKELRAEQRREQDARRKQDARIAAHLRWDRQLVDALRDLGGSISDPPPLYADES